MITSELSGLTETELAEGKTAVLELAAALDRIDPERALIFRRRLVDGGTWDELAAETNLTRREVQIRMQSITTALTEALEVAGSK